MLSVGIELLLSRCSQESGISDTSQSKVGLATCLCIGVSFAVIIVAPVIAVLFCPVSVVPLSCTLSVVSIGCAVFCDGGVFWTRLLFR